MPSRTRPTRTAARVRRTRRAATTPSSATEAVLDLTGFGVRYRIVAPAAVAQSVVRQLGHLAAAEADESLTVVLSVSDGPVFRWELGDEHGAVDREDVVSELVSLIERHLAEHSPTHVFVHAGVVRVRDRVIVLPGRSHAGKSTAVEALVRAGAVYYSDEYAPLDKCGLVHAFPRPINRRFIDQRDQVMVPGGGPPREISHVVFTHYEPEVPWRPDPVPPGDALLKLLDCTVGARTDPPRVLDCLTTAIAGASILDGPRGDADDFARALLDSI